MTLQSTVVWDSGSAAYYRVESFDHVSSQWRSMSPSYYDETDAVEVAERLSLQNESGRFRVIQYTPYGSDVYL